MQAIAVRGASPRTIWVTAGVFLTFGIAIPSETEGGDHVPRPEVSGTSGAVMQGVTQVGELLETLPTAAETEPAPTRPLPKREPPVLLLSASEQPQSERTLPTAAETEPAPLRPVPQRKPPVQPELPTEQPEFEFTPPPPAETESESGLVPPRQAPVLLEFPTEQPQFEFTPPPPAETESESIRPVPQRQAPVLLEFPTEQPQFESAPRPPAETESAPIRPVPQSKPPVLVQLPMEQSQSGLPEPVYEIEPLRQTEIQLAPRSTDGNQETSRLTLPRNHGASLFANRVDLRGAGNGWFETVPTGHVACINYHPLYFEELSLERYGDSFGCWQSLVSAAHFYGTVPILPYRLVASPPCSYESSCEYPPAATPAGHISCWRPIDLKAAAFEAGVIAAAFLLVP